MRNRFYTGYLHVPAYYDEPEQYVKGIHEALVDEDTFNAVQAIIDGDKKNNHVENLKWMSSSELTAESYRRGHGTSKVVKCVETGQLFSTINTAAYYLGIAPVAVVESASTGDSCFGIHLEYVSVSSDDDIIDAMYIPDKDYIKLSKQCSTLEEFQEIMKGLKNF